ncbi:MAG: hypothetical protein V1720_01415 [bacterium]
MRNSKFICEEELFEKAIRLLTEKFEPLETSRFLSFARKKRTESVKRHHQWQSKLNEEEFLKEIFEK